MDLNKYIEQLQNIDFNDIDWEKVGVWPVPVRVFLCLLAVGLIILAVHFLVIKDKNVILQAEIMKEADLKKSFESKAFEAANLERYRQQMQEMEASFGALKSRLPRDTEVPGLLDDITDKVDESRLTQERLDLQKEQPSEFYVELPINVVVTGGYHEFGAFVSGIAGMPRIVTLHDFSISQRTKQAGTLAMEITAKTYRYKAQEE